jgi:hypothetical protein
VNPRIPGWVHPVWDRVERRPWVAATTATLAAALALALWRPLAAPVAVLALSAVAAGASFRATELAEVRAERDQLLRDNAAKDARLRRYELGDASAATQQLRAIGETGEPT